MCQNKISNVININPCIRASSANTICKVSESKSQRAPWQLDKYCQIFYLQPFVHLRMRGLEFISRALPLVPEA